jgi:hypothetical protein
MIFDKSIDMDDFIKYCCDKGLHNFTNFKFERNSRIVMKEHFVSNKDIIKYGLFPYVQIDKFGRYKIPKFLLRKFSNLISDIMNDYLVYATIEGKIKRKLTIDDVKKILLNPNGEVFCLLSKIEEDLNKDLVRNRLIKIWNIKNRITKNKKED